MGPRPAAEASRPLTVASSLGFKLELCSVTVEVLILTLDLGEPHSTRSP